MTRQDKFLLAIFNAGPKGLTYGQLPKDGKPWLQLSSGFYSSGCYSTGDYKTSWPKDALHNYWERVQRHDSPRPNEFVKVWDGSWVRPKHWTKVGGTTRTLMGSWGSTHVDHNYGGRYVINAAGEARLRSRGYIK